MNDRNDFDALGGVEILRKIAKVFYDKVYAHPWISLYFKEVSQAVIESQQVDFMAQALGGPAKYCGKFVPEAHAHMMISHELFELREQLLMDTFEELKISEELRSRWLKIDRAFKSKVVKKGPSECVKRFATDQIVDFPDPLKKRVA